MDIIAHQHFGYEFAIYETNGGFLLWWSDYVANDYRLAFETLGECFAMLSLIDGDENKDREPARNVFKKYDNEKE